MTTIPEIHPVILDAVARRGSMEPRAAVYQLVNSGQVTWEDAELWERLTVGGTRKPPKPRRPVAERHPDEPKRAYVTRAQRYVERDGKRPKGFHSRYIRRQSLAPTLDAGLSAGCVRTLNYIVCRIGKGKSWTTYTSSIARDLALTARTVRVHLSRLARTLYVGRSLPDARGRVTLTILVGAEVPAWVALTNSADALAAIKATGRNLDSASYETSSSYSLENPARDPSDDVAVDEAEDRGSALVEAAPPLDHPPVEEGRVASPTSPTKTPPPGRTGDGLSAKPMRPSWPSVPSLDDHITRVMRVLGLSPGPNPSAVCSPSGPGTPAGSRRDGGS